MAQSNFDKRLLIEQIRYLEAEKMLADDTDSDSVLQPTVASHHGTFEDKLWHRATGLVKRHDLSLILERGARVTRMANILLLLIAALLGALGVSYAMSNTINESHTINVYWLLLVLLAFNFVSMLLWLVGINLRRNGLWASAIIRLIRWLPSVMDAHGANSKTLSKQIFKLYRREAERAWFKCHFTQALGRWRLSQITHQLWLAYLFSGLIFLMLMLSVRQYDFVWGTTLLSDGVFINLTQLLSVPLHGIGFNTPTMEQIQATRIGSTQLLNDAQRYHWAQFLLGTLLCFGVVPRLVLWLFSTMKHVHVRRQWTLDYYLPYYIHLRQQFMPLASHGQIVDADKSPPTKKMSPVQAALDKISAGTSVTREAVSEGVISRALPVDTRWVAVELGDSLNWPLLSIAPEYNLGQVTDRVSQSAIMQTLQEESNSAVAVAVCASRVPDRGVQRTVVNLMANSHQRWLVLLKQHDDESIAQSRLAQWYQLAQQCDVPADHVISMSEN